MRRFYTQHIGNRTNITQNADALSIARNPEIIKKISIYEQCLFVCVEVVVVVVVEWFFTILVRAYFTFQL